MKRIALKSKQTSNTLDLNVVGTKAAILKKLISEIFDNWSFKIADIYSKLL